MKKLYLFLFSLTFFSFLVFILVNYFFWGQDKYLNEQIENKYIDPSIGNYEISNELEDDIINTDNKKELTDEEKEKIKIILKSAYKIKFIYYPSDFNNEILDYTYSLKTFLNSVFMKNKIDNLSVELFKDINDVRWKMKNRTIKLFWVKENEISEFTAVWIHEFAHFVDLYFLKKGVFTDISDYYYSISWDWVKVLKPWLKQADFVSGYAMTNQYEDFAESFTYFLLHNSDFLKKSKDSKILKQKYIYFTKYVFRNKEFIWTNFSSQNETESYYRDITKIDFSLENFLEFMKKEV